MLSRASKRSVRVSYATSARTAVAGSDFVAAHGTLTFKRGQRTATIRVRVIGDALL
jgi:hypothetical protein